MESENVFKACNQKTTQQLHGDVLLEKNVFNVKLMS